MMDLFRVHLTAVVFQIANNVNYWIGPKELMVALDAIYVINIGIQQMELIVLPYVLNLFNIVKNASQIYLKTANLVLLLGLILSWILTTATSDAISSVKTLTAYNVKSLLIGNGA